MDKYWLFDTLHEEIYKKEGVWYGRKGINVGTICKDPRNDGFLIDIFSECLAALTCLHPGHRGECPPEGSTILSTIGPAARSSHTITHSLFRILKGETRHVLYLLRRPDGQCWCYGLTVVRKTMLHYLPYRNDGNTLDLSEMQNIIAD